MKAHVKDRNEVIKKLNSFADFLGRVVRDDTYWFNGKTKVRIRREKEITSENKIGKEIILLTYKKKENRISAEGNAMEVNEEHECELSSSEAIETFLTDSGFFVDLKKHKNVLDWKYSFTLPQSGQTIQVTLELCTVPPLGDFLEVEVLSEKDDRDFTESVRKELENLIVLSGIEKSQIENRYYSEMLRDFH